MKRWLAEPVIATAAGMLLLGLFFKHTLSSRFDAIPGNVGDARFLLYLCEHWYQVFTSQADWLSPGFFHPQKGVLGFSDSLFLFGAAYAPLRVLGLDPYTAYQVIVIALPLIGYLGAWLMLRHWLGFSPLASVLGASLFAYSSALYTSMAHAQLQAVSLLPFLAMLLGRYLSRIGNSDRVADISGLTFCIFFPLLAYTSFYTAWFFALWVAVAAALTIAWLLASGQGPSIASGFGQVKKYWPGIGLNAAVGAIFSLPFLITYVPVVRQFSRRSFSEVMPMLPAPIDLVNVGFENYAWGWLLRVLDPLLQTRPTFWELDKGLSLLVLAVFAYGSVLSLRTARRRRDRRSIAILICAMTVWTAWLLMLRVEGHSIWWLVHRFFPGAGAVRAVYRFNICLMLPVVVVVASAVDHGFRVVRQGGGRLRIAALLMLVVAMVAEQGNAHRDVLSKSAERTFMASVPPAPDYCRAMAIFADEDAHMGWWAPLQIDAMLIAQANHIPTLNGYSGWSPGGWTLHFPVDARYGQAVRDWAAAYRVSDGLCSFHYETRSWAPFSVDAPR